MSVIQGILLGILQGVAEFLPISSSGHLAVAQNIFGLDDVPLLFDIFLHLATLAAVVIFFRKKIWELLKIFGRWIARRPDPKNQDDENPLTGSDEAGRKTILAIIITTAITGAAGIFSSKLIPELPIKFVCAGFIVTALLLLFSSAMEKKQAAENGKKGISPVQAVIIGVMQGIGTLPGISRSGSTIAGALFAGVDRASAGEFSFIVSIPAILGAFVLELKDLGAMSETVGAAPIIAGCAASFAVGYISLTLLMRMIKKGNLKWFACYLIPAGILGLIFLR